MSKQKIMRGRNEAAKFVKDRLHKRRNKIELNTHNHLNHELMKTRICYDLQKQGKEYYTEAKIGDNIADIFVLDNSQVIEILHSETKEVCQKNKKFPEELEVVCISSMALSLEQAELIQLAGVGLE